MTQLESLGGLCGGFAVGLLFMFGLEHLTESAEEDGDGGDPVDKEGSTTSNPASNLTTPMLQVEDDIEAMAGFKKEVQVLQGQVRRLESSITGGSREEIDEIVHTLMYQCDRAKRQLNQPEPLDERNLARMRFHTAELRSNLEALDSQMTLATARKAIEVFDHTLNHLHQHAHRVAFRRWKPAPKPDKEKVLSEQLPTALAFGVTVDAAVDGLLVGLAFTAAKSAGWCMSIATCIEMCFLGLSFSASVQNATRSVLKHVILVVLPPVVLALSGVLGHSLGSMLERSPGLFIGFIAFAIVALLFLVTHELLTEAHEVGGEDITVNIMLFIGLLAGILLEKLLG